jgi:DNA-binding transcriptional MerR regulator
MSNADRYFTISELVKEFDVKKSHIRFCEKKGLILPRGSKLSRRIYSTYDHARLKLILHCVVVGYSQEQIVDLIGLPDANLDPNAQVEQGVEDAQKKIEELEHRRNEAKFHERTSIMTELNMMWEYIEEIKTIKLEGAKKPPAKPAVGVKEKEKTVPEPPRAIKTDVEKQSDRQPGRIIPVFAAGLALVLIIGGYFFYQSVQKKTTTIKLAQKEQAQTGTHSIYHQPVPSDQTVEPAASSPATKETHGRPSPVQPESLNAKLTESSPAISPPPVKVKSTSDATPLVLAKQTTAKTQVKQLPETEVKESAMIEKPAAEKVSVVSADDKLSSSAVDTETQKTLDAEVKEAPKPESALIAASVADNVSLPKKQNTGSPQIQPSSKDKAEVRAVEEEPAVKAEPAAPAEEKLKATVPETKTEKAPEVEIKETPKSETAVRVAATTDEASSAPEKQNVAPTETQQVPEARVQENILATEPAVEVVSPDESAAKEALAADAVSRVSKDRKIEIPQLGQKSEGKTEETAAWGKPAMETTPAESGSDKPAAVVTEAEKEAVPEKLAAATGISATPGKARETASTPSVGVSSISDEVSSAPEKEIPSADEVKEASAEPDTEQALVASKGNILEKEDPADPLRTFLDTYCQTYENKNLDKFFTFFAPDAFENNQPFHELMPKYRKNMEMIDSFKYRIEILAYSTQADTGNVRIQGKFFTQYLLHGGSWKDNRGNISMELVEHGDSFLVKQLNYGK